ncbi:(2Fe-2S) ferredoxin domain-containing protein [Andreprevotia chitinilytica]|uniref:(2Fe-2S) ferredoxin domain-containing protein n=1 Tax=Andreprevotia chitinilytica TaxID=396808 RepID=UPI0005577040|nr:(2Fe-2S) ferredoxin domain-containing protein [Andreprevotia chitinilytica]
MKRLAICINRRFESGKPSCAVRGSEALADAFEAAIAERGLDIQLMRLPCMGLCEVGPNVKEVGGDLWSEVSIADVDLILDAVMGHDSDE